MLARCPELLTTQFSVIGMANKHSAGLSWTHLLITKMTMQCRDGEVPLVVSADAYKSSEPFAQPSLLLAPI